MEWTSLHRRLICSLVALAIARICAAPDGTARGADRIVLRNLKILSDRTVSAFDPDGVRLDDGTMLGWDEIEKATLANGQQAAFDRLFAELGGPLYRIRQRLSVGDYRGLLPQAEAIADQYADRDSPTSYMVLQSLMWGRLAVGRREEALEPYLRCCEHLRRHSGQPIVLPGERRLAWDPQTGLSPDLAPIWFDAKAAGSALPRVLTAVNRMQRPRPEGVNIYFAALALTAGETERADRVLAAMASEQPALRELREIVLAQQEIAGGRNAEAVRRLDPKWRTYLPFNQPLALYWLGLGLVRAEDRPTREQGLLYLLRIPALYGGEQPDVAAAALYHSWETLSKLDDARGSVAVRKELLERYGQTYFAGLMGATAGSPQPTEGNP